MNRYMEAEKRLAELLGYKEIFRIRVDGVEHGSLQYNRSTYTGVEKVPQWCHDWDVCGPLMVEHSCYPYVHTSGRVYVRNSSSHPAFVTELKYHPDKETAVRYSIVEAVIANLSAELNKKDYRHY